MILGAIEISLRSTRFSLSEVSSFSAERVVERSHGVTANVDGLDRITALLMSEVEFARDQGAERIEVTAVPALRGSRLVRLLDRVADAIGVGPIRIPTRRDWTAATFLGVTIPAGDSLPDPVAVAVIGETAIGFAVGRPGDIPEWIGSRPVGASTMTRKARFQDPPRPGQIEAAVIGASRGIASMFPPETERVLVVSPLAAVVERLCGPRIGPEEARKGLDAILGQTSDDISAWFGAEAPLARHLPGIIVGHAALAEGLGVRVEPALSDLAASRFWLGEREELFTGPGPS
ncbi:MAG: hypothetical protein KDB54_07235 [Solirubrobacterales bacterium]|nr:hypothetical protein [Solirubrobacterales bacterium]